jgi:simple sugar transport system permease protein
MESRTVISVIENVLRRREFGPAVGLVVLIVTLSTLTDNLFTRQELNGASSLTASIGTVAIGVTFLMISGEFDLSVGAVFALSAVVWGKLIGEHNMDPLLALVLVLLMAMGIGLANGLITTQFGIPSFITTLAALLIVQGVDLVITGGNTIVYFGQSKVVSMFGGEIGSTTLEARVLWFIGLTALVWYVLERTPYGNATHAAGGRAGVARAMGISTRRVKTTNFVVCSLCAGLAGVMQFASYGAASANDGQDYELFVIVAAVIGGTSLFGVTGTVIGTFIGAAILGLLQTGLILVGVSGSWYTPLIGVILVVAVIVNVRLSNLSLRGAMARFALDRSDGGPKGDQVAVEDRP